MESAARMIGEVDWDWAGCGGGGALEPAKDEDWACWALVSCSNKDCDESNSKDRAGSEMAFVVAS